MRVPGLRERMRIRATLGLGAVTASPTGTFRRSRHPAPGPWGKASLLSTTTSPLLPLPRARPDVLIRSPRARRCPGWPLRSRTGLAIRAEPTGSVTETPREPLTQPEAPSTSLYLPRWRLRSPGPPVHTTQLPTHCEPISRCYVCEKECCFA